MAESGVFQVQLAENTARRLRAEAQELGISPDELAARFVETYFDDRVVDLNVAIDALCALRPAKR